MSCMLTSDVVFSILSSGRHAKCASFRGLCRLKEARASRCCCSSKNVSFGSPSLALVLLGVVSLLVGVGFSLFTSFLVCFVLGFSAGKVNIWRCHTLILLRNVLVGFLPHTM